MLHDVTKHGEFLPVFKIYCKPHIFVQNLGSIAKLNRTETFDQNSKFFLMPTDSITFIDLTASPRSLKQRSLVWKY